MPKQIHAMWQCSLLLSLLLILPGCGTMGASISGKVIDKSTGKPIEGAIVVAYWEGSVMNPIHDTRTCFHVESATSNKKGKFRIPFWAGTPKGIVDQERSLRVYKEGYTEELNRDTSDGIEYLVPFTGMLRGGRLEYLFKLSLPCEGKELLNMYKAIYEEANNIAITRQDKLKVLYLLKDMEKTTIGTDKAWERFRKRKRELK